MRLLAAAVATSLLLPSPAAWAEDASLPRVSLMGPAQTPRRGFVIAESVSLVPRSHPELTPGHRLIYLNREGGAYSPGVDDSFANRSSVIEYYRSEGGALSPFSYGDEVWSEVVSCVQAGYAPFDVTITDQDPGSTPHIEIAVAGRPEEIGLPAGCCLGVAPFACSPVEGAVTYAFAGMHPKSVDELCWTVLQESAHALGLDHERLCEDAMSYQYGCGLRKAFLDQAGPCGEQTGRPCMCGGATQNSAHLLQQRLGPNAHALPPRVRITAPSEGDVVIPGFEVVVSSTHDMPLVRAELVVDGVVSATDEEAPWSFATSPELEDGTHEVAVRAFDAEGTLEAYSIRVTVGTDDPDGGGMGGCALAPRGSGAAGTLVLLSILCSVGRRRR
jgi:hypothetical protein